jgi:hypothetical protein
MTEPNVVHQKCKSCGEIVPFLVPEAAKIREACKCGLTENARVTQAWTRMIIYVGTVLLLVTFGGCWVDHYYTTEQIKALPENRKAVEKVIQIEMRPKYKIVDVPPPAPATEDPAKKPAGK